MTQECPQANKSFTKPIISAMSLFFSNKFSELKRKSNSLQYKAKLEEYNIFYLIFLHQ